MSSGAAWFLEQNNCASVKIIWKIISMLNQTSSVEVKIEVYNLSLKKIIFITEFNEI